MPETPEYAQHSLDAGVVAFILVYRHFGASDGEPRQRLDPWKQMADYRTAIDAVSYLDEFGRRLRVLPPGRSSVGCNRVDANGRR